MARSLTNEELAKALLYHDDPGVRELAKRVYEGEVQFDFDESDGD